MKKIISFLLACVILSGCFAFTAVNAEEIVKDAGGFFPGWGHKYQIEKSFEEAPQTFEAVVYMPAEYFNIKEYYVVDEETGKEVLDENGKKIFSHMGPGKGGIVLGNYNGRGGSEYFGIEYGHPVLYWHDDYLELGYYKDNFIFDAVFEDVNLADVALNADGTYSDAIINISIARDYSTQEVYCYINGELKGTLTFEEICSPRNATSNEIQTPDYTKLAPLTAQALKSNKYVIGGDNRSMNSSYFRGGTSNVGTINRIAVYNDARTADEIAEDYANIGNDADGLIAYFDFSKVVSEGQTVAKTPVKVEDVTGTYVAKRNVRNVSAPKKGNFTHSIAVVGDTQILIEADTNNGNTTYADILYGWIADNIDSSKIKYMIGVGDITNTATQGEYTAAINALKNNIDGKLPYILTRGNHDKYDIKEEVDFGGILDGFFGGIFGGGSNSNSDPNSKEVGFETALADSFYDGMIPDSQRLNGELRNSYTTANINGTHFLFLTLDFGADDSTLAWADTVINSYPNHNVIVTTHSYLNYDGDYITGEVFTSPDYNAIDTDDANNTGAEMWEKFVSKHENICMVLSGHVGTDHVMVTPRIGENGNKVVEVLTDHQDVDTKSISENGYPLGIVTMLYFMGDGKTVNVETISTARATSANESMKKTPYYYESNQFSFELDLRRTTGDVDNDGTAGVGDVVKMLGEFMNPTAEASFCDQTGDGKVSLMDIMRVMKAMVK